MSGRHLLRRLAAHLLLTVFLGGGMGLQELDALLAPANHDSNPLGVSHLDPPGGCGAHAEHCVLVASAAVRPLAAFVLAHAPLDPSVRRHALREDAVAPPSAEADLLHPARAPPAAS